MPFLTDAFTIVVGDPDEPLLPEEAAAALESLSPEVRRWARLAPHGPQAEMGSFGQQVADSLGEKVLMYSGLPVVAIDGGVEVIAVGHRAARVARPLAQLIEYRPAIGPDQTLPIVCKGRDLAPDSARQGSTTWRLAENAVAELVPCGVWAHPNVTPADDSVRAQPIDPQRPTVVVEGWNAEDCEEVADRVLALIEELDPALRADTQIRFAVIADPEPEPEPEREPVLEPEPVLET